MAKIIHSDGREEVDALAVASRLSSLGIVVRQWAVPGADAGTMLQQQDLSAAERDAVLAAVEDRFEVLKATHGYTSRDLIVIHEDVPGIQEMLRKFDAIHYHDDDEVRYVLAGRGYFGFAEADGSQFLLEVTAGDYINVPARTEHWFEMRDSPRIKAVRYFITKEGWVANYTERARQFG